MRHPGITAGLPNQTEEGGTMKLTKRECKLAHKALIFMIYRLSLKASTEEECKMLISKLEGED